jgi:site-specific DNA-methyltransferase (adenine-specific)
MEINKIYNEHCLETINKMPDNFIDLMVTSPPYNVGIWYDSYEDRIPWKDYYQFLEDVLAALYPKMKEDGRLCINHYLSLGSGKKGSKQENGVRTSPISEINQLAQRVGYNHHSMAVWPDITLSKKTAWGSWKSASAPYINSPFEAILFLYKNKWKKENKGESTIEKLDFVKLTRGRWEMKTERKQLTKANFPVELPLNCINLLSYVGDVVYDPFMGAGTTALACVMSGRNYIGSEISENYCEVAEKRIEDYKNSLIIT